MAGGSLLALFLLLAHIQLPKEGHDLCPRAVVVGAEQAAADAGGHAIAGRLGNSPGKVAVGGDIGELRRAGRLRV